MRERLRQHSIRQAAVLLLVLVSVIWVVGPAASYAPLDELMTSVTQLLQAGQIFDGTVAQNLLASLQTIGAQIEQGNKGTAAQLLTAFSQEVSGLSGVLMTPTAASQLVEAATKLASEL